MYVFAFKMKHVYDPLIYFRHVRGKDQEQAQEHALLVDPLGEILDAGLIRKLRDREVADDLLAQKVSREEIEIAVHRQRSLPASDGKPISAEMKNHIAGVLAILAGERRGSIIKGNTIKPARRQ